MGFPTAPSPTGGILAGGTGFRTAMRWIRHPGRALDAFADAELDGARAARVAAHLDRCPRCQSRLRLTLRLRRSLRAMAARWSP